MLASKCHTLAQTAIGKGIRMPVPTDTVRGTTYIPRELERALRDKIRVENPAIAQAPLGALLRYIVARTAGMNSDDAARFLYRQNGQNSD